MRLITGAVVSSIMAGAVGMWSALFAALSASLVVGDASMSVLAATAPSGVGGGWYFTRTRGVFGLGNWPSVGPPRPRKVLRCGCWGWLRADGILCKNNVPKLSINFNVRIGANLKK